MFKDLPNSENIDVSDAYIKVRKDKDIQSTDEKPVTKTESPEKLPID